MKRRNTIFVHLGAALACLSVGAPLFGQAPDAAHRVRRLPATVDGRPAGAESSRRDPPSMAPRGQNIHAAAHQQALPPQTGEGDSSGASEEIPRPPDDVMNPQAADGLTLAELEEIALANNPTLAQGQALLGQARGNWLQVGLYPNPVFGYQSEEIGDDGTAGKHGVFLRQRIVRGHKLRWNRAVAARDVDRARWQWETQRMRVLNSVRMQYFQVLGAQRLVATTEELLQVAERGVEIAEQLVAAQESPRTDVLQAQVELSNVEMLLRTSRHRENAAWRELTALVGAPRLPHAPLAGDLQSAPPELSWDENLHRLLGASPLLQSAQARLERARAQVQRERVQPIPDLQLQGGVMHDSAGDQVLAMAQAGVMLPIYNRNQGNISAAVHQVREASAEISRLELVLQQQLAEAHQRYDVARTQVESYRDSILPRARETLDLTTQAYELGELDFFRVLTARRSYIESYRDYIGAWIELQAAAVQIDGLLLTGGLNDIQAPENPGGGGGGSRTLTAVPKTE